MDLGQRFDKLCEALEMTYAQLSHEIGMARPDKFYHMKAGKSHPNFETIDAILKRFPKVNANFIFGHSTQIFRDMEEESESEARQIVKGITDDYEFLTTVKTLSKRILQLERALDIERSEKKSLNERVNDFVMN